MRKGKSQNMIAGERFVVYILYIELAIFVLFIYLFAMPTNWIRFKSNHRNYLVTRNKFDISLTSIACVIIQFVSLTAL